MSQPESEFEPEVAKQLLNYFLRNTSAADSLEGLTRWRLLEEQIHRSLRQTEVALRWLVSKGLLVEVKPAGSVPLFRLDLNRYADATKFLAEDNGTVDANN